MISMDIKKVLVLLACTVATGFATQAFAADTTDAKGNAVKFDTNVPKNEVEKKATGANLNLFPPPKADLSKSARPAKPELVEPAYRAEVTSDSTTLKWNAVATADAYHLQLATDPVFKWLVVNEELYKGTSFEVKGLEKGKHYFWRVAAMKTDNAPTFMTGWFSLSTFETPETAQK
jgi:hypothetical protein